jgi:hypothetical protein
MEVTYSSETSVGFQRTTWRYIPEDRTLHCLLFTGVSCTLRIWDIFSVHELRLQEVCYLVSQKDIESPSFPPTFF